MLFNTIRIIARYSQSFQLNRSTINKTWQISLARHYAGKFSRQPAAIVNEDELFEVEDDDVLKAKIARKEHRQRMKKLKRQKKEKQKEMKVDVDKKVYTKIYENEKFLSNIVLVAKSKSKRKKDARMCLEGVRLMSDAIESGVIPEYVIYSNQKLIDQLPPLSHTNAKLYKIPYKTLQLWSSLTTSPGIMGIYPVPQLEKQPEFSIPLTVICDNIRDPGNMGSVLRAAAAVGCEKIILSKGCVDIWDSKVLRSAAGAHFKLSIHNLKLWPEIVEMIDPSAEVFAADNSNAFDEEILNDDEITALEKLEDTDDDNSDAEDEEDVDEVAESKVDEVSESTNDELQMSKVKENKKNEKLAKHKQKIQLAEELELLRKKIPSVPYFHVNYTKAPSVLIVGGETEGLSEDSLKFLDSKSGIRVNIPLYNNVESLNTGMAMGIIAFEINRQYESKISEMSEDEKVDEEKA